MTSSKHKPSLTAVQEINREAITEDHDLRFECDLHFVSLFY